MGLLPWVLWALTRAARHPVLNRLVMIGIMFSSLVLTHHPTAFIFAPFASLYALGFGRRSLSLALKLLGGLVLGLVLSAIFWIPAIVEMQYVDIGSIERGMFNVSLNFVELGELLAPNLPLDRAALNPPMPHNIGWAQLILAGLGITKALRRGVLERRAQVHILAGAAGALLCLSMTLPAAEPIWKAIPLGQLIAFPWRLIGVAELCLLPAMAAAAFAFSNYAPTLKNDSPLLLITLFVLILFTSMTYLYPIRPSLHFDEVTRETAIEYELESGALGTVSANEYLPRWVEELPTRPSPDWDSPIDSEQGIVKQFYFPGWQVTINGEPVEIAPTSDTGLIRFDAPATGVVKAHYVGTSLQHTATSLSAISLVVCIVLYLWSVRAEKPKLLNKTISTQSAFVFISAILIISIVTQLIYVSTDWFRPRSDSAAPAKMTKSLHRIFHDEQGEAITLLGYDMDRTEAAQGDTVTVRLYWRALRSLALDYWPFVHWDSLTGQETWANSTLTMPGSAPTSRWNTTHYVIDTHKLHIPIDAPPLVGNLSVGLFDPRTGKHLCTVDGQCQVKVSLLRVVGEWPDVNIAEHEGYRLGDAVRLTGWDVQHQDNALQLSLLWRVETVLTTDYTIFLHVIDSEDEIIAYGDRPPLSGAYPTTLWLPGQAILDEAFITLPKGAGERLTLAVGFYDPTTGIRLPAFNAAGKRLSNDSIILNVNTFANYEPIQNRGPDR
jgi:hypothetical protein